MNDPSPVKVHQRRYILDGSALAIYLAGAIGREEVADMLVAARAKKTAVYVTMSSLTDLLTDAERRGGEAKAQAAWTSIQQLPIKFVDIDRSLAQAAAHIRAHYSLEKADPFAAALAERQNAILVTSDREYQKLGSLVSVKWLSKNTPPDARSKKESST